MSDQHGQSGGVGIAMHSATPLVRKIEAAREELLDLTVRNRLLHTPRGGRARIVEVVDELAQAVYRTLVIDKKRFTFQAGREDAAPAVLSDAFDDGLSEGDAADDPLDPDLVDLTAQPDLELDESGRLVRHWDSHLSTRLTSSGLQKRLLDLYVDARTLQEEQGVNVLYLAIGYLTWRSVSVPNADRHAPLILVPVVLERSNAGEKFHLKWCGDDIQANLSLQLMLRREFQLKLPDIEDFENLDIDAYFAEVSSMVEGKAHWAVSPNDAVLGLFSFAKFMMYRDLDPAQWIGFGGLDALSSLRGVVTEGFPGAHLTDPRSPIDDLVPPAQMLHIVDSDSSQSLVVHDVRQGASVLVQGPPGTGKSQTIANIIAAAVADGKTVLFVAEKMAALEVVKRRLDTAQIGVACLELHSNKANKRALLQELSQTWLLGGPQPADPSAIARQIQQRRDELTGHVERLHRPLAPSHLTPYEVLGHLVRLRRLGHVTRRMELVGALTWDADDRKERTALLQDLIERIEWMGLPRDHAWVGVGNHALLPNDRDRLIAGMSELLDSLEGWITMARDVHGAIDLPPPTRFADVGEAVARATALVAAPTMGAAAFEAPEWSDLPSVHRLVQTLESALHTRRDAAQVAELSALALDWTDVEAALSALPAAFGLGEEVRGLAAAHEDLLRLLPDAARLAQLLSEAEPLSIGSTLHLVALAERATSIPLLDRDALVAQIWDRGVDGIQDTVDAVERVQAAKARLKGVVRDNAWSQDLEAERAQLAAHTGWFKVLSGQWRGANRKVRSHLTNPKLPADDVLAELDTLLDAQSAQRTIAQRGQEGAAAFGSSWAGEGSNVAFLRAVVTWMRALRPLGADARNRLAAIADPEQAAQIAKRLRPGLEALQQNLTPLHEALVTHERVPWGGEVLLKRVPLSVLRGGLAPMKQMSDRTAQLTNAEALSVQDALSALQVVRAHQAAVADLDRADAAGCSAFGTLWQDSETAPATLHAAVQWQEAYPTLRVLAARDLDAQATLERTEAAGAAGAQLAQAIQGVFLQLQLTDGSGAPAAAEASPVAELAGVLRRWAADPEGLPTWVAYVAQVKKARQLGLAAVVDALHCGALPTDAAIGAFELAYFEAVLAKLVERDPPLATFDGQQHAQRAAEFAQLDRERMDIAKRQILAAHHARIPPTAGFAGPARILRGEMAKKRRHLPIRQLMEQCAPVVQALKPVFMMSPLSVAQFLPPGVLSFDMLIVDEASQVQPVDAFGAVARARQLVIVGDERQLPPTQFFSKTLAGEDATQDEGGADAPDVESILGLCKARGLPDRMLEWHYRSRHQSLIAVSNREFYENRLKIVPSPFTSEAGVGLRFHHLPDAVYDRGGKRINLAEAKTVAQAVIAHAQASPELSLGVVAFSTQQRRAIFDEVELLRRQHPETEGYFAGRPDEPFFVKNLENVQGDERDVIFISIGYGRDAHGAVRMEFGPVSRDGGERRLNVLISRAKARCEVFSSITDEDIDTERGKGKGVLALKLFLHYARTGRLDMTGADPDRRQRVFEEQVATALRAEGYDLHTDVGIAGFFVALAVADSGHPGRYILGVEFDGPSYRSSNGTRDRDRLREHALVSKGWHLHRLWIYDWFQRPEAELARLVSAIEAAKLEATRLESRPSPARAVPVRIEAEDVGDVSYVGLKSAEPEVVAGGEPYVEAHFSVPHRTGELHEVQAHRMAGIVEQIVAVEGPVHRNEVVARVRTLWGLQRAGARIQGAVDAGIHNALSDGRIAVDGTDCLNVPDRSPTVRDRSSAASPTLRRPDYLPPSELDVGIVEVVRESMGASVEEAVQVLARRLGYKSTSAQLRVLIEDRAKHLIDSGRLELANGAMRLPAGR